MTVRNTGNITAGLNRRLHFCQLVGQLTGSALLNDFKYILCLLLSAESFFMSVDTDEVMGLKHTVLGVHDVITFKCMYVRSNLQRRKTEYCTQTFEEIKMAMKFASVE